MRDTRKTLPGLRALEKAAVAAGGGVNHRYSLVDGLLIKDNHVAASGGVGEATRRALAAAGGLARAGRGRLPRAARGGARRGRHRRPAGQLRAGATSRPRSRAAVANRAPIFVEASGGVTLDTAAAIAATGVDAIAVGALTHSAPALDIGLDVGR